jgi:hypothetical protein
MPLKQDEKRYLHWYVSCVPRPAISDPLFRPLSDHAPFVSPKFNVNAYANAILAGEQYDPEAQIPAPPVEPESSSVDHIGKEDGDGGAFLSGSLNVKGDVALALSKLDYGIVGAKLIPYRGVRLIH